MNPIPWLLWFLPKKYRKYAYLILFILTIPLGVLLLFAPLSEGAFSQALVVIVIIGIFLIGYWYGWKQEEKKNESSS